MGDDASTLDIGTPARNARSRRAVIVASTGLLVASGLILGGLLDEADARKNTRKRNRKRIKNRRREREISRPGEPGADGEDGTVIGG